MATSMSTYKTSSMMETVSTGSDSRSSSAAAGLESTTYILRDSSILDTLPVNFRETLEKYLAPVTSENLRAVITSLGPRANTCPLLQKLPVEIRDMIYRLLLFNPELGEYRSTNNFKHRHYGLSPNILSTCRRIRDEAYAILYGENIFRINCTHQGDTFSPSKLWDTGFHNVRKWRFVISGDERFLGNRNTDFVELCQKISGSSRSSLIILQILLVSEYRGSWNCDQCPEHHVFSSERMKYLLKPLQQIRNLKAFEVRLGYLKNAHSKIVFALLPNPALDGHAEFIKEVSTLVLGTTPYEPLFNMFKALRRYAQTFERSKVFATMMGFDYVWFGFGYGKSQDFDDDELEDETDVLIDTTPFNPFLGENWFRYNVAMQYTKHNTPHPVELNLHLAWLTSGAIIGGEDPANLSYRAEQPDSEFKAYRKVVIDYLEPQYKRIVGAAFQMSELIKEEKKTGGMFNRSTAFETIGLERFESVITILWKYANALSKRDMPKNIKKTFARIRKRWRKLFYSSPREKCLRELKSLKVSKSGDEEEISRVITLIKAAVDDMDGQYLRIRAARKGLLEFDTLQQPGIDLGFELFGCDEMVNWSMAEPDMRVAQA